LDGEEEFDITVLKGVQARDDALHDDCELWNSGMPFTYVLLLG
jgi:hypothetical protein